MRRRTLVEAKYLEVTPVEVQWVTVEVPVTYHVKSNTQWNVS